MLDVNDLLDLSDNNCTNPKVWHISGIEILDGMKFIAWVIVDQKSLQLESNLSTFVLRTISYEV